MSNALHLLLERLSTGDNDAAAQVFTAYEPFLRMVVRRHLPDHLRSRFDSQDIVQSVWVDLLQGFRKAGWKFADADHLRAFLQQATRNRLVDRIRQHQRALDQQRSLAEAAARTLPVSAEPSPSKVVQAMELWDRILAVCPPAHRDLVRFKKDGLPLAEIAARTGFHISSVRRILYELERQVTET